MSFPYGRDYIDTEAYEDPDLGVIEPIRRNGHDPDQDEPRLTVWEPVALGPYLRGEVPPPQPGVGLYRTDGVRFLYPGLEHSVIGEMESGKSWFCLAAVAAELDAGRVVSYIHFEEDTPASTVERLLALGVPPQVLEERFRFHAPQDRAVAGSLAPLLADPAPSLVILDGVNEGMALHGQGVVETEGSAAWRRRVVKPCTRVGAAVLQADHTSPGEGRERYSFGSQHKANGANGPVIRLENREPFGRGRRGVSHVFVVKDRPGYIRIHGREDRKVRGKTYMGTLVVDDTQTEGPDLLLKLFAPTERENSDDEPRDVEAEIRDAIIGVLGGKPDQSVPSWRKLVAAMKNAGHQYRDSRVRAALEGLVEAGEITEAPAPKNGTSFTLSSAAQVAAW